MARCRLVICATVVVLIGAAVSAPPCLAAALVHDLPCIDHLASPHLYREPSSALLVSVPPCRPSTIPLWTLPMPLPLGL
ncbi:hypothetical protein Syun_006621 [Stephania yunnanensis]|uniref:Uncharacterized protein n=1 Tax=Stephania yunnanensis TaxID=152371 RepID=A0AAP0KXX9_9MAGN